MGEYLDDLVVEQQEKVEFEAGMNAEDECE